jgi:hypothetical protein
MKRVSNEENEMKNHVWARPGMQVTVRAELMPGHSREQRTFRVKEVLSSGRVTLEGFEGEHSERQFEPIQFGNSGFSG